MCRFYTCKFTYLLKFICNPQNQYWQHFCGHLQTCRVEKNFSCLICTFLAKDEQGDTLPSCFSSHPRNSDLPAAYLVLCTVVLLVGDFAV